ncbi:hypothetical protein BJ138DRAFT_868061 [Hygrophoropsis aurantiaca]|uniref:Uncharacterized protein n=1 Tax=Hygrophoropsis aurantiaca TaxID=72124 RepID=A0ACB7ZUK5_9AGAM|nr:hypothetical protein BJ138DRAFT_868061 [Hygrophoropsis aurantiaca]
MVEVESTVPQPDSANSALPVETDTGPIPLSFPALLRNPKLSDRYAHLRVSSVPDRNPTFGATSKKNKRDDNEGKRWVRRKENAKFSGNPHIVTATKRDYTLPPPQVRTTFPEPLPAYLSRNTKVPSAALPTRDIPSANAGRFSLSLKGMRKELRRWGARAESLVKDVENELLQWLEGGTWFSPDAEDALALKFPGTPVKDREYVREVLRTPSQLVWMITGDAFTRYVVHCCARYHSVISFSKEVSGERLTYLLRPNATRPDYGIAASLDTPPVTETDYSSQIETESDFVSEGDLGESDREHAPEALDAISEASRAGSPAEWSIIGGSDIERDGDISAAERDDFSASLESLSLSNNADQTPRAIPYIRSSPLRSRAWIGRQGRSASSPSRSPVQRLPRRAHPRVEPKSLRNPPKSFYEFLFA